MNRPPRTSKFGNKKLTVDGEKFDSQREYKRFWELSLLQTAGKISGLKRQVTFVLVPKQGDEQAVKYLADFTYLEGEDFVVEDVKGVRTAVYIIKRKLMLWVQNIKIRET